MAEELFSKGNEAFVAENYEDAVELYSSAIDTDNSKAEFFIHRAHAYIKLENYSDALVDARKGIDLDPKNGKAYLREGVALYHLDMKAEAKGAFEQGLKYDGSDKTLNQWCDRCVKELSEPTSQAVPKGGQQSTPQTIAMPIPAKIRHDWYQTETHVIVTILIKNVKKEDLTVEFQEKMLSVTIRLSSGSDYSLELDLANHIVPEQSITKILSSKIEIKMKKAEGVRWTHLEGDSDEKIKQFKPTPSTQPKSDNPDIHKYPSSSHSYHDWDRMAAELAKEEKEEKLEGDAALNKLFQQIYSDGSDEVKRAMNKSFSESGGTVLSTNWGDIGAKKTEVKPPDGMEYKSWEY
ncbi:protein SGT1 homolog [Lingula anatina]|uniref:Protein SGT1 homolog n=1 Tax=Lingula anatina TaxID=7574 RepID=A0A1S3JSY7_LINAN|nr:protein SGT1 homolog [Lingula anatina]|eukprot:XP_013413149.1 protein SGT1 homolog [Lingula anatina]